MSEMDHGELGVVLKKHFGRSVIICSSGDCLEVSIRNSSGHRTDSIRIAKEDINHPYLKELAHGLIQRLEFYGRQLQGTAF